MFSTEYFVQTKRRALDFDQSPRPSYSMGTSAKASSRAVSWVIVAKPKAKSLNIDNIHGWSPSCPTLALEHAYLTIQHVPMVGLTSFWCNNELTKHNL